MTAKVRYTGRSAPLPKYHRIQYGRRYVVSIGAGLDSERLGVAVDPNRHRKEIEAEPGRYKPFEAPREVALKDVNTGEVFTMFKAYLRIPLD